MHIRWRSSPFLTGRRWRKRLPEPFTEVPGGVAAPKHFQAAGVSCGLKESGGRDLALIYSETPATAAALFTTNRVVAAPVELSRENVEKGLIRAILINSGNANACTGEQGLRDAREMAEIAAHQLGISPKEILVASTGPIGRLLPMDRVRKGIELAVSSLTPTGGGKAAEAILTTDTRPKEVAVQFEIGERTVTLGGMAKGSGMIAPHLATLLAFITSDIKIEKGCLKTCLQRAVDKSFDMITVDGDTSTNDMVAVLANGAAGNDEVVSGTPGEALFQEALNHVCIELAKMIVKDGEGATKFLEIRIKGAASQEDARKAAMAVANSNLVKTAFFGEDPNWGRIICALGYSGAELHPNRLDLYFGDEQIVKAGSPLEHAQEKLRQILKSPEIVVHANLHIGESEAVVWTCDLSYDYVRINSQYHT
ncbi:MAG: Arginine biosynthesis bifunctional protein ArgJ [Actinobacteria bacterium]|nr:Arginine biosynthesis bifunctional protein ArgJ [Actinomycetota bacterium]GFP39323.1 glutamate N-acetyltransferase / amino-acid N-acetyltransferase [Candidatus Hakubella thermalkaliphila]